MFAVGGVYLAEAPIALIAAYLFFSVPAPARRIARNALYRSVLPLSILGLFALIGIYNGAEITDVYSDFRAMAVLIVSLYLMFAMNDEIAIRVILVSWLINISLYAILIAAGLGSFVFSASTFASGKLTLPIFAIIFGALYIARKRLIFLVAIACLAVIGSSTSLRYIYALFGYLVMVGAGFAIFGFQSKASRAIHILSLSTIAVVATVTLLSTDFLRLLIQLEIWARNVGFGEQIVHQVLVKTQQNFTVGLNWGDALYLQFAAHLLDFERFFIPHGLGHEASIGQEVIFYGGTIDNSVIFLNYHFGILVMLFIAALVLRFILRLMRGQDISAMVVLLTFIAPIGAAFYMRGVAFTEISAGISMAMALRGLHVLANDLRKKKKPIHGESAVSSVAAEVR